jgi:rubrerythrin
MKLSNDREIYVMIYTCDRCRFTFNRVGKVDGCPSCSNPLIREAAVAGKEEYRKNRAMNEKMEIFFDYTCPYCLRGHEYLLELISDYRIEPVWCPCEAHPHPESYGPHSDLCIQGMFYALEQEVDMWAYHEIMYRAALKD